MTGVLDGNMRSTSLVIEIYSSRFYSESINGEDPRNRPAMRR